MDKAYSHTEHESKIYKQWEEQNAFMPKGEKSSKPFTIIMPPPNASDPLHIGHARFVTVEDVLIRYHRMRGDKTLWLPGADHAGIETQFVFEKKLKKQGKSRFDYNRETLYQMIWDDVEKNKKTMESQLKQLGASCDWSRNTFTLDPEIVSIVYKNFKRLYDEGLIYRGERIVNYSPSCGTFFSELEVEYIEREDLMYYIDYGGITIATTRPETIFADVAIAVPPKSKKYKSQVGKTATIPLIGRKIPIIEDSAVDPEYGTGALKVTPAHDPTDFEIGQRHNLSQLSVIDMNGRMINVPEKYLGKKAKTAREEVAHDLEENGFLVKTKKITHTVGVDYRHKEPIEPMISKQWFLKTEPLAKKALAAIKDGSVKFASKQFEKKTVHWLKNLKDWNISRQIVWGIQIPAWRYKSRPGEWIITDGEPPKAPKGEELIQDTDTFDTWFSSGQWPFATLEMREGDFKTFYPTTVMATAADILFLWVSRMIMLGIHLKGDVPFRDVVLHGLVRDKAGDKISKSKGNVIDPGIMIEKYGADALRMSLIWGALIENDIALSEENIKAQRNFANKLWNVSRFVLMNKREKGTVPRPRSRNSDDKDILKKLKITTTKMTKELDKYRLNNAAETLYSFVWNDLANTYLEKTKNRRDEAQKTLEYVLQETLKLAHPMMPFVTEAIWSTSFSQGKTDLLITTSWPK